jgi:hypothetical protein
MYWSALGSDIRSRSSYTHDSLVLRVSGGIFIKKMTYPQWALKPDNITVFGLPLEVCLKRTSQMIVLGYSTRCSLTSAVWPLKNSFRLPAKHVRTPYMHGVYMHTKKIGFWFRSWYMSD